MFHYFLAIISTLTHLGISLCHMDVRENILFPTLHSILVLLFFFLPCHRLVLPNKKAKLAVCVHVFLCVCVCLCVCFSRIKINSFTSNYVHYSRNTKFTISLFDYGLSIELNIYLAWMYLFYHL